MEGLTAYLHEEYSTAPGEGEIRVKGRGVFMGYLDQEDKTHETVSIRDNNT